MSDKRTYTENDEFWLRARIYNDQEIDVEDEETVTVELQGPAGEWDGDETYVHHTVVDEALGRGDPPIVPGDSVEQRYSRGRVGRVISLSKGHAFVDWQPDSDEETAFSTPSISSLIRVEAT